MITSTNMVEWTSALTIKLPQLSQAQEMSAYIKDE